jgi:hypothetical protein
MSHAQALFLPWPFACISPLHVAPLAKRPHSQVDGVPVFRAGEEVYLFLWERPGEPYRVLGWAQGTFRIARNADTGVETVTQDSALAPIFDPRTRSFRHGGIRNLSVGIFQLKLRKALEEKD